MLQLRDTRFNSTKIRELLSGVTVSEEGMALVYVKENGVTKVQPSLGVAGEEFAGISFERNTPPASVPYVAEGVIPAGLSVELPRTPIAGQLRVTVAGVGVTVVAIAPADATEVQLSGSTLTFFAGEATKAYTAQFLYEPSVSEARALTGDGPFGGLASGEVGTVGVINDSGAVFTSMFDGAADWSTAMYVRTIAGGKFTPCAKAHAERIPGVVVLNSPNAANPFLGLTINVA